MYSPRGRTVKSSGRIMGRLNLRYALNMLVCVYLITFVVSGSMFHSFPDVSSASNYRRFLQAKKSCPVNFEFQNYTIITSKCIEPNYPPKLCCSAFKDFACPFAHYINDLTTDCAIIMFNYINIKGRYPPGLFDSECRETKMGLECPPLPPPPASQSARHTSHSKLVHDELLVVLLFIVISLGFWL